MSSSRHYGPYPEGDQELMTPKWKQDVRDALKARGEREQWLANKVAERLKRPSMKRDTINKMLRRQKRSVLVPHVTAILGIDPPYGIATPATPDAEVLRLIELIVKLPPERRRALTLFLDDGSQGK